MTEAPIAFQKRKEAAEARAKFERERKELNDRLEKQRREHDALMRRTFGR
ncbi:MAG: hypothetical protein K2Y71_06750 [Xanthobacteraceae bacterium]|nr:hypothetical protein [Xanthobacteraceae bacterium]